MDTPTDMKRTRSAIIAVVDDEQPVLESVADFLESAGYAVSAFQSAQEFLDSNVLPSIACLISDIHMPVMDGWELQAVVHAERANLPMVLITGRHVSSDARRVSVQTLQGAALRLFKKPFDAHNLLVAVNSMVRT